MYDSTNARTETPEQFTDGHDIPRGGIDAHGDPIRPSLASDGPSLTWEHFRKKFVQVENSHDHVVNV